MRRTTLLCCVLIVLVLLPCLDAAFFGSVIQFALGKFIERSSKKIINHARNNANQVTDHARNNANQVTDHAINRFIREVLPAFADTFEKVFDKTIRAELNLFYQKTDNFTKVVKDIEDDFIHDLTTILLDTECSAKKVVSFSFDEAYDHVPYRLRQIYYLLFSTSCQRIVLGSYLPSGRILLTEQFEIERCDIYSRMEHSHINLMNKLYENIRENNTETTVVLSDQDFTTLVELLELKINEIELIKRYYCYFSEPLAKFLMEEYIKRTSIETGYILEQINQLENDFANSK